MVVAAVSTTIAWLAYGVAFWIMARAVLPGEWRDLTRAEGLPGRPWLRHLVYAPLPSYAAETLPGVREAVLAKDSARVSAEAGHLAQALRQAADRLEAVAGR